MRILSILFLFLIVSCNEKTVVKDNVNVSGNNSVQVQNSYPHSEIFKKSGMHGTHYKQNKQLCQSCHVPVNSQN